MNTYSALQTVSQLIGMVLIGFALGRFKFISSDISSHLSRVVIDVFLPALIFVKMAETAAQIEPSEVFLYPILGVTILSVSMTVGMLLVKNSTTRFLIGVPNWVYLPLALLEGTEIDGAVERLLLLNLGAQFAIWTLGVGVLSGQNFMGSIKEVVKSVGLWATVTGFVVGWLGIHGAYSEQFFYHSIFECLRKLGDLTIPLAMLIMGVVLAFVSFKKVDWRSIGIAVFLRQIVASGLLICVFAWLRYVDVLDDTGFLVTCLVSSMPSAVSAAVFAERYNGDSALAAQAAFVGHILFLPLLPVLLMIV